MIQNQKTVTQVRGSMNKYICFTLLLFVFSSCLSQRNKWIGRTDEKILNDNYPWFQKGQDAYSPDTTVIKELKQVLPEYRVLVFAGVWCPDTRALLPAFYKTTDMAGVSRTNIDLYLLDRKKGSPEKLEGEYRITSIPTFIFLKDGIEKARIVESIEFPMEKALLEALQDN